MTRFDADTPTDRRKLVADAVTAHRTRGSAFLTLEAEPVEELTFGDDADAEQSGAAEAETGDAEEDTPEEDDEDETPPWIQFSEKTFNLDVTDEELDLLKTLVGEFPEFRIDQLESPDSAEGTNVRISARSDANRLADFTDRAFQEVYDCSDDYRLWVVAV